MTESEQFAGDSARGEWDFFVVLLVFGVGLVVNLLTLQFLKLQIGELAMWHKVSSQMTAFLTWWVLGVRMVQLTDSRGSRALGLGPGKWGRFASGVYWFVPLFVMWFACSLVFQLTLIGIGIDVPKQAVAETYFDPSLTVAQRAILTAVFVVGAAMGEEMIFRGLLHGWMRRYSSFWVTAVVVGALFGLMHVDWEKPVTIAFAFPLGLLGVMLSWLRERRGGLPASVAMHACFNATNLILMPLIS